MTRQTKLASFIHTPGSVAQACQRATQIKECEVCFGPFGRERKHVRQTMDGALKVMCSACSTNLDNSYLSCAPT